MTVPTPAIPKGSWVLITGVNGHVASELASQFLERGYRVRGTVRDLAKSSWLVDDVFKTFAAIGDFELIRVPDIVQDGAFDAAVKGVSAVAHVAAFGFGDDPNKVIPPTIASMRSILKSAAAEPSVKRFVYTSSVVAAAYFSMDTTDHVTHDSWNDKAVAEAWSPPPHKETFEFAVYMAGKVAGEKELWRFVTEEKPQFVANAVNPQTILGRRLSKNCSSVSAAMIPNLYNGIYPPPLISPCVYGIDVKEVALMHVAAVLDLDVKSARIHVWGRLYTWNQVLAAMRKLFPKHTFVDDISSGETLKMTVDQTLALSLLKKWGGQDDWRKLEDVILDNLKGTAEE